MRKSCTTTMRAGFPLHSIGVRVGTILKDVNGVESFALLDWTLDDVLAKLKVLPESSILQNTLIYFI